MKLKRIISAMLLFLVFAVPSAFAKRVCEVVAVEPTSPFWKISLLCPLRALLCRFAAILPKLLLIIIILLVGYIVAIAAKAVTDWVLKVIKLEKGLKNIKADKILKNAQIDFTISGLLAEVVFYLIIAATLITAAYEYNAITIGAIANTLLGYMPAVVAASLILILGILLAILASGFVKIAVANIGGILNAAIIARLVKSIVLVFVGIFALRVLGFGTLLSGDARNIILAGICLALALAFGIGAKDIAAKTLSKFFKD